MFGIMKKPFKNIRGFIQALRLRCYNVQWLHDTNRVYVNCYSSVPYDDFVMRIRSFTRDRVAFLKVTELSVLPNIYLYESRFMIDVVFY